MTTKTPATSARKPGSALANFTSKAKKKPLAATAAGQSDGPTAAVATAGPTAAAAPDRKPKNLTVRLEYDDWEAVRRFTFNEQRSFQEIAVELFSALLERRGLPPLKGGEPRK